MYPANHLIYGMGLTSKTIAILALNYGIISVTISSELLILIFDFVCYDATLLRRYGWLRNCYAEFVARDFHFYEFYFFMFVI